MPCTGKTLTLPNITCLDFKLDFDISGAAPMVKVTNNSTTGTASALKWWFYITSPSGVAIYGVDVNTVTPPTPDVNGVAWTTKTFALPSSFNPGQCGQVEFSPSAPYTVTVFVQDTGSIANPIDSYSKSAIIVRPSGNSQSICGNFGKAYVNIKVDCANKNIMCFDGTKMIYNNILTPLSTSRKWTMVYPIDEAGDVPNMTSTEANVNFPASTNSKGYMVYLQLYATYDYGNGITVKVQYKLYDKSGDLGEKFAVNCNTNLCILQCQMKKFYELSKQECGAVENAALTQRMNRAQWLFSQILTGIFQPLCGIDVPGLIEEMQREMGFSDGCDCGCDEGNSNFGFSNPIGGGGTSTSSCCPQIAPVLDINTGATPAVCPGSFFPAAVYSPDESMIIGMATSADSMVSIINADAAWGVYGTAFNMGNCQVGFYLNTGISSVPPVIVSPGVVVNVVNQTTGLPPASCPASYFPVTVYAPDGTTSIGTAANVTQLITIINSNTAWQAYGTAYYNNALCTVAFVPASGVTSIPPIVTSGTSACVGGIQHYTVQVQDICGVTPPPTSLSFPFEAWVDFGTGPVSIGEVTDNSSFLAALNGATGKPTSVTFSTSSSSTGALSYDVDNSNCTGYSGTVEIYTNSASGGVLMYSGNHKTVASPHNGSGAVYGVGMMTQSIIGRIAGLSISDIPWHITKVQGNYLYVAMSNTGRVFCYDITNPLMPSLVGFVDLPDISPGSNCFQGTPGEWGVPNLYSLYFPTDYHTMITREVYVMESNTGCIWCVDFGASPSVTRSYYDQRFVGMCPRVHWKGDLYFSQEGDLSAVIGGGVGVAAGFVIQFHAASGTWNSGSLNVIQAIPSEEVWAASFDPATMLIYFSSNVGSIVTYDVGINSFIHLYNAVMGHTALRRLNTKFYLGKLYHSTFGSYSGLTTGTIYLDTTTLGGSNVVTVFQPFNSGNSTHWNFMPLGNCTGVLTYENGTNAGGFALFLLDGTYLGNISFGVLAGAAYNVVPIAGVSTYTPNNLV